MKQARVSDIVGEQIFVFKANENIAQSNKSWLNY